jgi:hypothetical protein
MGVRSEYGRRVTSLRDVVARLAAGSQGRTEADVQADVRAFLLDAPLELAPHQVVDVALEAQAGGGRRIDVEAGCAVIEVKKSLTSTTVVAAAIDQLAGYVKQRIEEGSQRYVGVLTDGQTWILHHLEPDGTLAQVSRLRIRGAEDAHRLAAWLEPVLATTDKIKPTPREIVDRLGAGSPAAQLDLADLRALYAACRSDPEVQLKRQLWARLLLSALGTNFDDSDELFVTHTYLVLVAELVAHQVMGLPIYVPGADVRALLEGQEFEMAGLHGVVEADFFDWPATVPQGLPVITAIARRLSAFDWSEVDHDILKALYMSVIDTETRRRLGEYYTPDWLAHKIVEEQFTDPLTQRLLDPACGSGTFLFWAIRRLLAACDAAGMSNRDALKRAVQHVQGIDLHPVAVTLARVTYLLALTPERLADREDLTVPVFLGDSVLSNADDVLLADGAMKVTTSDEFELFKDDLHFPESVLEEPVRFDRLVADLASRASKRKRGSKPPPITGLLNRHNVIGDEDRQALITVFQKLCRLHDGRRDHVWSYYIRNRARPLAFTHPDRQAHVLVGNPPWLAYRHMSDALQRTYRTLAEARGLWAGGKVATHQDLSDLFVARAVEQYLNPEGTFAFVMPFAVLSRRQFAGFRTGNWSARDAEPVLAQLARPEDFAAVRPVPFGMPCCVVSGTKASPAVALPADAQSWTGRLPSHHTDWKTAVQHLKPASGEVAAAVDSSASPYRARFTQGAALVPRMLVTVRRTARSGQLGLSAGRTTITSARSALEKAPWRELPSLTGVVENEFLRPMHLGSTIVAYRARGPELAIIPWVDGRLLDGDHEHLDEFPGLALWWRRAERAWEANKSDANRLSLRGQIDFHAKLRKQFPIAAHRVVYTASGQHLAACRLEDSTAIVEKALYWSAVESVAEGRYLTAILNSRALAAAVAPLQARGQHNPRHFDMHVFELPFPTFDPRNGAHAALAQLAARAEQVAAQVQLDDRWQFQRARRVVREALQEDGVARTIDEAVSELLTEAITTRPGIPDLVTALAAVSKSKTPARTPLSRSSPARTTRSTPAAD